MFYGLSQKRLMVLSLSCAVLLLGACEKKLYVPGNMSHERITVEEQEFFYEYQAESFDQSNAEDISAHYHSAGEGPVGLTIYYDPRSRENTALHANQRLMELNDLFRKAGIQNIEPGILPVKDLGDEAVLAVSYAYFTANKPDCEAMPGYHDRTIDIRSNYKMGCTIDTLISQQVVDPRDLVGRDTPAGRLSEGRSASNVVEPVRAGVRNEPLEGFTASGTE